RKLVQISVIFFRRSSHCHNLISQRPKVNTKSNGNRSNHGGRSQKGAPSGAKPVGERLNEIVGTQRNERGKPGQKIAPDNSGAVIRQQQYVCKQSHGRNQQHWRESVLAL